MYLLIHTLQLLCKLCLCFLQLKTIFKVPEIPRRPSEEVPIFVPEEEKVPEMPARGTPFLLKEYESFVQFMNRSSSPVIVLSLI